MKFKITSIMIVITLLLTSCGMNNKPSDTITKLMKVNGNTKKTKKYYTNKTVALMDELTKLSPNQDNAQIQHYNSFNKDVKWKVIEEKIEDDTATVTIEITKHANAHMKGTKSQFKMKKEKGTWKIDMEEELEPAVTMLKNANKMLKGMGNTMNNLGNMFTK